MLLRKRIDHIAGTIGASPPGSASAWSSSTLTASILTLVPTIAAPYIVPVIMDPLRAHGEPEIVYITAHTSGASTATVMRGMEGTIPRAHYTGDILLAGPTKADFIDDPWIDLAKALGVVGDNSTDNATNINLGLTLASVGASWQLLPATNFDLPVPVRFPTGNIRFGAELKAFDAVDIYGNGVGSTKLIDTRSGATKAWTISTTNNSANITVTAGTQATDDMSMIIRAAGIPAGTFIVGVSGSTVTLSQKCTATASGVSATVVTVVSLSWRGPAANDRIDSVRFEGVALRALNATGHDNRIGLLARHVSHLHKRNYALTDFGVGLFGHNLWDSSTEGHDIQYCGSRSGEPFGATHLTASGEDGSDCNEYEIKEGTFENNYQSDVTIIGHSGRRPNKNRIGGKLETSFARGPRILIDGADCTTIDDGLDLSVGDLDSGVGSAIDMIVVRRSLGTHIGNVMYEQKGVSTASVRDCVRLEGGNDGVTFGSGRISNGGSNPTITGASVRYVRTYGRNDGVDDTSLPHWNYDGSGKKPDVIGSPDSRPRGNARRARNLVMSGAI